jgi:hypothetical protein
MRHRLCKLIVKDCAFWEEGLEYGKEGGFWEGFLCSDYCGSANLNYSPFHSWFSQKIIEVFIISIKNV